MSSPANSPVKDPTFSATDQNPATQDEEHQQSLRSDQNPQSSEALTLENPTADDPTHDDAEEISGFHNTSSTSFSRRVGGGGGRRKKRNVAQEKKSQRKFEALATALNLVPFAPSKSLDLSSREPLLRRLGLWDFAHLDFDFKLRHDLILQLIAGYIPKNRASKVNEVSIKVGRADLARALSLPVRKEKGESALKVEESEESVSFVLDFVSSFVLLHEDTWMMSDDVMNIMKLIKEGNFEKVDFATLIWIMVEKELKMDLKDQEPRNCYYGSHLQLLIKSQREDLLKEPEVVNMEIDLKEEEEKEEGEKVKEELPIAAELEEQNIELSLGGLDNTVKDDDLKEKVEQGQEKELEQEQEQEQEQGQEQEQEQEQEQGQEQEQEQLDNEDDAMEFEESKENEQKQWYNSGADGNFLQRCDFGGVEAAEFEERKQEEQEENEGEEEDGDDDEEEEGRKEGEFEENDGEGEEMGFGISPKGVTLDGIDSENLIEAIEASQNPFSLGPRGDTRQNAPGSSGLFNNGNGSKRMIDHLDTEIPNKRIRGDEHWDNMKPASDFDICMEQMNHVMGKARVIYDTKEQTIQDLSMQNQMLLTELENRNNIYHHNLAKMKMEEQQKRQVETYRLERELYMMENLLEGYRKALKETTRAFSEYRNKFPLPEEPIYKDTGSGGLVLSAAELERQRLKREEEERVTRILLERKIKEFEAGWMNKLEELKIDAEFMSNRLLEIENGVSFCKEEIARRKETQKPECGSSEEQVTETAEAVEV